MPTLPAAPSLALDAYSTGQFTGRAAFVVLGLALLRAGLRKRAERRSPSAVRVPAQAGVPRPVPAAVGATVLPGVPTPAAAVHRSWPPPVVPTQPGPPGSAAPASAGPVQTPPWERATDPAQAALPPWEQSGTPSWAPPGAPAATHAAAGPAGVWQVALGAVLLLAGVVGLVLRLTPLGDVERDVALPAQILGLTKDEAASAAAVELTEGLLEEADELGIALYGTPTNGLLIVAATADVDDPEEELARLGAGAAAQVPLGEGVEVDPGRLGGTARCWPADVQGTPLAVCGFVDHGSVVATFDSTTTDLAQAGARGRQVREAVVSEG